MPKEIVINEYFAKEKQGIQDLETQKENCMSQMEELKEEHSGDDGLLEDAKTDKGTITKVAISARIKKIKNDAEYADELNLLKQYLNLINQEANLKKSIKNKELELDKSLLKQYPKLSEKKVKNLVIDKKWLSVLGNSIDDEQEAISQKLSQRIKELATLYNTPISSIEKSVNDYETKVKNHLSLMLNEEV